MTLVNICICACSYSPCRPMQWCCILCGLVWGDDPLPKSTPHVHIHAVCKPAGNRVCWNKFGKSPAGSGVDEHWACSMDVARAPFGCVPCRASMITTVWGSCPVPVQLETTSTVLSTSVGWLSHGELTLLRTALTCVHVKPFWYILVSMFMATHSLNSFWNYSLLIMLISGDCVRLTEEYSATMALIIYLSFSLTQV